MSQYVIEILADDLSRPTVAEWVAAVGKSPPIDLRGRTGADLVREGRRFTQAYATVPETLPSHTSMMSGLYPGGHGVHQNARYVAATTPLRL